MERDDTLFVATLCAVISDYALLIKEKPNQCIKECAEGMLELLKMGSFDEWEGSNVDEKFGYIDTLKILTEDIWNQVELNALVSVFKSSAKEIFSDWETMECGSWSQYGSMHQIGEREVEVGLYREPMDNDEYAGTYTLHIFDGDDVIYCEKVF